MAFFFTFYNMQFAARGDFAGPPNLGVEPSRADCYRGMILFRRPDREIAAMLTAKGQESDRDKGLALGADEYMTKPFSPSKITERVREILVTEH